MAERFWEKVDKLGDCWVWTAATNEYGYGKFMMDYRAWKAHHVSWLLTHGCLPENIGLRKGCVVYDHLCRNPACVNPDHGQWVEQRENVHRGSGISVHNARKTHCTQGHEFSKENTSVIHRGDGRIERVCLACKRRRDRERGTRGG